MNQKSKIPTISRGLEHLEYRTETTGAETLDHKPNLDEWNKKAIFTNNPTSIKNEDGQPLSLAEWYTTIQDQNPTIPKTEFQSSLNLRGYSYNQLFNNILKIKDPKIRDTMFRFHARCLPINYLHSSLPNIISFDQFI
ncbi:hypothetical protein ACTFIU_005950 [Dictyostelium citrinum]